MIKMKIAKDFCTMGYAIFIYEEDSQGRRRFVKPVQLEISGEFDDGTSMAQPTFKIDSKAFDFAIENDLPDLTDKMLKQKEQDKGTHIKSLESVIELLVKRT